MEVRGQLQVSVLSFLRVGLGDLIQVVRPVSKCLVLNHLPKPELKKKIILHVLCVQTSETIGWSCPHRELWDWNSGQACVKLSAAEPSHWLLTPPLLCGVCDISVCRRVCNPLEAETESPASQKNRKPPQTLLLSPVDLISFRVVDFFF